MTDPKQSAFLAEYKALCERHGLYLCPSMYDSLQVWPLGDHDLLDQVDDDPDTEMNVADWLATNQALAELSKHLAAQPRLELRTGSGDLAATFPDFSQAFPDKR